MVLRILKHFNVVLIALVTPFLGSIVQAQDIQFSQFYSVTPYINPAYVGGAGATRVIVHGRYQWPGLDAKYETGLISVDHYFHKYNSGAGIMVEQDVQGLSDIKTTKVTAQYSYQLTVSKTFNVRAGLRAGYGNQIINYAQLYLPSQIDQQGNVPNVGITGAAPQKGYFDVGSGLLVYSNKFWATIAFDHMNRPNLSLYNQGSTAPLYMKTSYTVGYKIPLSSGHHMAYLHDEDNIFLTPTALYKMQGKSDQVDVGCYLTYNQFMLGAWYRGIEFKRYEPNITNSESVVGSIGWLFNNWSVTYSYDFTVSTLVKANTGGSHELNITYTHHKPKKGHKTMKRLPCPDFYHSNKHQQ
jgi:type IX secretion system PorP/SprF family membrane protein